MKNHTPVLLIAISLSLSFLLIAADDGLRLIHADKSIGRKENEQKLRIFSGNVHFQQDTIHMYCKDAIYNETLKKLTFKGDVFIQDGVHKIRAREIEYYPDNEKAICKERVRVKTPDDSLYAEYMVYFFEIDSVFAEENVYVRNVEHLVQIWGNKGWHSAPSRFSRVIGNARLIKRDTTAGDSLDIYARQLDYAGGDSAQALAVDSVIIYKGALKAICDTARYFPGTQKIWLTPSPNVWYDDNQLSGLKINALFDSLNLKRLFVYGNGEARSRVDSLSEKENILRGQQIRFDIEEGQPQKIRAVDQASSIYYLKNERGEKQGSNFATADTILIHFKEGEVDSIQIIGGAEGVYYPENYEGEKAFETKQ